MKKFHFGDEGLEIFLENFQGVLVNELDLRLNNLTNQGLTSLLNYLQSVHHFANTPPPSNIGTPTSTASTINTNILIDLRRNQIDNNALPLVLDFLQKNKSQNIKFIDLRENLISPEKLSPSEKLLHQEIIYY
eukprot:TRINITY_DN12611_c0_g1_i1.p1 TRINITY_DN12611_c0_g1~~TRINITY_DN12611_c0_g1_i1.p1  ORF type:complete len:133 (-),score=44.22 TRINITY_DN12611_c0_g1_i1:269-667(-)